MYGSAPSRPTIRLGGGGPPPPDILALLGVLFFTFSLSAFLSLQPLVRLLQLSRDVWQRGFVWQIATYPFAADFSGLFFLLALLIIFWFGRDVFNRLGRRIFWRLFALAGVGGALAAVITQLLLDLASSGPVMVPPFSLMQGDRIVITIMIAAFATLFGHATIYLFFILPIRASWFLWLEILFAFVAFLGTKDFAGFVGISTAVAITYFYLSGVRPGRLLRELRLRLERWLLQKRLERMRRKSGLRAVDDDDDKVHRGPWVN